MSAFLSRLELVVSFIFELCGDIFNLMMNQPVLSAVLALWVLDRIFGIFDYLKG